MTMVDDQSRTQRDRLVETAKGFSGDLEQMVQSGPDGLAGDVARQVAEKVRALSEQLDGREPSDILEDVRDFARRRPGVFLLGALGAGVAFGRLTRGVKDAKSGSSAQPVRTTRSGVYGATPASAPVRAPADDPYPSAGVETSGLMGAGQDAGVGAGTGVGTGTGVDTGTGFPEQGSSRPHGDPFAPAESSQTPLGDDTERRLR